MKNLCIFGLSLMVMLSGFSYDIFAKEKENPGQSKRLISDESMNIAGEKMHVKLVRKTIDNKDYRVSEVTSGEGTISFIYSLKDDKIDVTSKDLSAADLNKIQKNADQMIEGLNLKQTKFSNVQSAAKKTTGSWLIGKWNKHKVTANGKFTAQTLIGILGATFGFPGAVFSGIANIAIQYGIKEGYYKVRQDVRILDANYMEYRVYTKLYKDKKYKKQVGKTQVSHRTVWAGV
ncbi:hypothetical protein [Rummeliibacillus sp. TYF-LIM-RU47]|uniref:hypothetical protein n=1 Tax=Rummeliibacillus sp. TYF-LIM-RU47 TaxID=2608406 RepID=UPI00123BCBE1|nr:hypothetical protein [Rummeliibacillus sp. TYF-LIM-RU47]